MLEEILLFTQIKFPVPMPVWISTRFRYTSIGCFMGGIYHIAYINFNHQIMIKYLLGIRTFSLSGEFRVIG